MNIKKFNKDYDYNRIIKFLTDEYIKNQNMTCWLPQRFDDLIFRIDTLYHDERSGEKSSDYIYIFEENDEIAGLIISDGDSFNSCIKEGFEYIFPQMLDLAERELLPLFKKENDGSVNFLVVSHDSLKYQSDELIKRGYARDNAGEFDNVQITANTDYKINLPDGYNLVYGENISEIAKIKTCHYGFHPKDDDENIFSGNCEGELAYQVRKKSQYYKDSFETLVKTDDGDYCSYCFCYVDKITNTGFIEPVSTREKYRRKGLCREMLHGVINRCREIGIEKVYINSFDWRRKVYNSSGFETIDSIGFWYKNLDYFT